MNRIQLEQWLGDDANNSENLVSMLHELLTGEYNLDTFRSDVSSYEVNDEWKVGDEIIAPELY
jgi:hypothetical protein